MTSRAKNAVGLLAFALAAAAMLWFVRRTQRDHLRAIDAIPADAFLVVTVDVDLLRRSPLGAPLLDGPGARLFADETVRSACGFDPLSRMREVAVAVPVEDESGEFGVAIRADVGRDELVECARKVIDARGGADKVTIRQSGSFTLVEPDGARAPRYPTLAYREGGPFLVARGPWLGTMIDTTEGKLPSAQRESRHLALRRSLGQASDDHPTFALVATVLLPRAMRERIRRDMGAEVAGRSGDGSSPALMAGVLGVESAGVAVLADDGHGETTAAVELRCEDEAACAAVARVIDKTRKDAAGDLRLRLFGLGTPLENLTVEVRGATLRATTHAPSADVARWLDRALASRGSRPAPVPATPPSALSSDEVIHATGPAPAPRPGGDAGGREAGAP